MGLMTFYELYHVAIPLFLPSLELSSFFMYRGPVTYPHCDLALNAEEKDESRLRGQQRPQAPYSPFQRHSVTDRVAWLQAYTDWYRFPHIQYSSSVVELVHGLRSADLQSISAAMRRETEHVLPEAATFWSDVFAKVLDGSSDSDNAG